MEEEKTKVEIKKELSEETPSVESNVTTASNVEVKTQLNDVNSGSDVHPKAEPNNETSSDSNDVKPTTDLDDKIIRQVEYYFGDYNLPKDKFLKEQTTLDDGWVPIATMLKFARLSLLTKSPQVIMSALKKSTSGLLEVLESSSKIRRVQPLPEETEERVSEVKARTIYCKGFPKDGMNIDKLLDFFKDFPTVLNVKMRYYKGKDQMGHFKGSITATFSTKEEAEKFMTLETVKYNDYTLQRQWSTEWEKEKAEEYETRQNRRSKKGADENGNGPKAEKDVKTEIQEKIILPRGTVLKLVNLPSAIDRDQIKKAFANYPADIAHVEITPDSTAFVRLRGENDGKLVLTKLENNKISVGDASCDVTLLDGDEEEEYMKKAEEHVNNHANNFKSNRGRGGGRGGGRGRGRGRGGKGRGYKGQKRSGSPSGSRGDKTSKQSRNE